MEQTIQGNLCRGLRAVGIPKAQAHTILNIVERWYDDSGMEWTNQRIKDLRQWYESYLSGDPKPPEWFKHSKDNMPLGIWNWVFKLPVAKALGVLSLNTCFYEPTLSEKQKEKFLHALAGNGNQSKRDLIDLLSMGDVARHPIGHFMKEMPGMQFPTPFDMNGSVPVHGGHTTLRPDNNIGKATEALAESWKSCPTVTYEFLDCNDLLGYMPWSLTFDRWGYGIIPHTDENVGRVSVIQQPELKARVIGNPNRVLQKTLEPLQILYQQHAKRLKTDVTHNQEEGISWVQAQLREGVTLSGSDLTSASDLLDIELSLLLVDQVFRFSEIPGYREYAHYLLEVSKSKWWCPALDCQVQWSQGSVLGTNPSFGLLTLTNNAAAYTAYRLSGLQAQGIPAHRAWRVVGDDIIMRDELAPWYSKVIQALGGEINFTKTLTSNKVAEFAGRIILPQQVFLKRVKYAEPSDNSFMSYCSQLGEQARYFLKPRQRETFDVYRYIPGIAVEGPWMGDSYGEPLEVRYRWYLECVQPVLDREEPDLPLESIEMSLLRGILDLQQQGGDVDRSYLEPAYDEGYLPSFSNTRFKSGGDPRLVNGQTLLDALNRHLKDGSITPYNVWKDRTYQDASYEAPNTVPPKPNQHREDYLDR